MHSRWMQLVTVVRSFSMWLCVIIIGAACSLCLWMLLRSSPPLFPAKKVTMGLWWVVADRAWQFAPGVGWEGASQR